MSEHKPYYISYGTELSRLWDEIQQLDLFPKIFPPPIKVVWEGDINTNEQLDKSGNRIGIVLARLDARWAYLDTEQIINPVDYHLMVFHYAFMNFIGKDHQFEGKLSGRLQLLYVWHNLIHEMCHYVIGYNNWVKMYDDSDDLDEAGLDEMLKFLKEVVGSYDDEKRTEYAALIIFAKVLGYDINLLPKFDGPFMKKKPKIERLTVAILQYFYIEYCKQFSPDRLQQTGDELINYEWKIVDFLLTDYNKNEKVVYLE